MGYNGVGEGFVTVIVNPHGDTLLAGFLKLQWEETTLIKLKFCKYKPTSTKWGSKKHSIKKMIDVWENTQKVQIK